MRRIRSIIDLVNNLSDRLRTDFRIFKFENYNLNLTYHDGTIFNLHLVVKISKHMHLFHLYDENNIMVVPLVNLDLETVKDIANRCNIPEEPLIIALNHLTDLIDSMGYINHLGLRSVYTRKEVINWINKKIKILSWQKKLIWKATDYTLPEWIMFRKDSNYRICIDPVDFTIGVMFPGLESKSASAIEAHMTEIMEVVKFVNILSYLHPVKIKELK